MKRANEKKQDFLLDALSCIDEDILERGLALRDSGIVAAKQDESAEGARGSIPADPYLYDLSKPTKPPRRNPWRTTAVVAAACLLFCVIPLSVWMGAKYGFNLLPDKSEAMNTPDVMPEGTRVDTDMREESAGMLLPDEENNAPNDNQPVPGVPQEPDDAETDGWQAPNVTESIMDPEEPAEDATEPETVFAPEELIWSTVSKTDSTAEYSATGHNGASITLIGTKDGTSFPTEDEMALRMVGQWLASLYTLDYGYHFPLFYESFVQEVFIKEAVRYGLGYRDAIQRMEGVAADLLLIDEVYLTLHLVENIPLTGEELEAYRDTRPAIQTSRGFDPAAITAVRRVRVSGNIEIDGFTPAESVLGEVFYLYEYEGAWYLDEDFMDDDLSIDLLGTHRAETGFYKTHTATGTVVAIRGNYLYLDTGKAFRMDSAAVHKQTDGGEWHKAEVRVGDTVTVTHYSLTLEGLLSVVDPEQADPDTEWELSTATRIDIIG